MKWIGQHIWDYISRFRNDVYFENVENGTTDTDKFLIIGSSGKLKYRTGAEVASDIGASGDITGVTAGTGLSGGGSSGDVTLNVEASQTQITAVGTITTGVWRGTAIASAYLDADTAHISATKEVTHHNHKADQDTTETYLGLADADSEETSTSSKVDLPLIAPAAGKLLKIFLRSNKNINGHTLTWRLRTISTGANFSSTPAIIGAQSGAGCTNSTMTTYDFTTGLDSEGAETNVVAAGDAVHISLQSDTDFGGNVIYYATCLWEWDLS